MGSDLVKIWCYHQLAKGKEMHAEVVTRRLIQISMCFLSGMLRITFIAHLETETSSIEHRPRLVVGQHQ